MVHFLVHNGSIPDVGERVLFCKTALCFGFFCSNPNLIISFVTKLLYRSRKMSEGAGVRVRRQPERLHPGNNLKNLNNTFTNALVVVDEEPESAESQEKREYSDLDSLDGLFSGEIFLRTSYTQCNNGKNKWRPETLKVKF